MEIRRITMEEITERQFADMLEIESFYWIDPYTPAMLEAEIRNTRTYGWIRDGRVLGYVAVEEGCPYEGGNLYIVNLNVQRMHLRQGIATALIRAAFRDRDPDLQVMLDVCITNDRAVRLYRKLGFRTTVLCSNNGDTDMVMAASVGTLQAEL